MLILHLPGDISAAANLSDFLAAWQFEPLMLAPLAVIGCLYLRGLSRLLAQSNRLNSVEGSGRWLFVAGYVALALALLSPIHSFSEELFFVHMVQHMLLMSVAAPLLLLANPTPAILWALRPRLRLAVGHTLAPRGWPMVALSSLTHPLVAWPLFVLNLWIWHQPGPYQSALESESVHYGQHLLFFLLAVLFWWPVIGPSPLRSRLSYLPRMLYVFLAWVPNSVLGAGFTFAPAVLMRYYESRPRHWGVSPLTDQQLAGLIMWIPGDLIYAAAMMVLLLAMLRQEDREETRSIVS